jgi:2-oxo-3-(phosphooxy)propyl 3-oxoalkanoate synthase
MDAERVARDVLGRSGAGRRAADQQLRALNELPFLTPELRASHIQLLSSDPAPPKIDPEKVRKHQVENCLLSEPFQQDYHVLYFNLFTTTNEIVLDHQSDHLVGLMIMEAVRQIGMACSHVWGEIPGDTRMSLQEFSMFFYNYIELGVPLVARAIGSLSYEENLRVDQVAFIDVRQNGITCLAGTSSGRLFTTEDRYQRIRGKTELMNERYAEQFAQDVGALDEAKAQGGST